MAASVDAAKLFGGSKKENYASSSESEGEGTTADEIPSTVVRPSADGLPQVSYDKIL